MSRRTAPAVLLALVGLAASAAAAPLPAGAQPAALRDVAFEQRLGEHLPLELAFRDEAGGRVRLGDYFGRRPVVLSLVYYGCPMLCTLGLNGLASALGVLSFEPGREFEVVTVSFDPRDTPALAAERKAAYLRRYGRPEAARGWHFLTGEPEAVRALAAAVGFRYAWDDETRQFAHPSGLVVLTPEGRIARYLFGVEYAPKDLRLAVVESAAGRVGGPVDKMLLYCYRYDPARGRYGAAVMRILRTAAAATVLALAGFLLAMWRREHRTA